MDDAAERLHMSASFTFHRQARSKRLALTLAVIWGVLLYLYLFLDAAPWIVAVLAAFTLPALADLVANPASGLTLTDQTLSWHSGRRSADLDLTEIDHMRLDTRLDFSVRATAVLQSGRKIRLPFEATPPHQTFEDALAARGIKTRRTHFQLMQ